MNHRTLALRRESLGSLDADQLRGVGGGHPTIGVDCMTCLLTLDPDCTTQPMTGAYGEVITGIVTVQAIALAKTW